MAYLKNKMGNGYSLAAGLFQSRSGGTPPPSTPNPQPWDTLYEQQVGGINTNLANEQAQIAYEQGRAKSRYGIDDASDPFSRMQMLRRRFDIAKRGTTNSLAAQGQLYAGSMQTAQDANVFDSQRDEDSTKKEYDDLINSLAQRRSQAEAAAAAARLEAQAGRVDRSIAARPDPPPAPEPPPAAPTLATPPAPSNYVQTGLKPGPHIPGFAMAPPKKPKKGHGVATGPGTYKPKRMGPR